MDCHSLLQGIFPNQGSKPGLRHCRQILYWLSQQGNPYRSYQYLKDMRYKQNFIPIWKLVWVLKTTWKYNYQNLIAQKLENLSSPVFVKEIESLLQKLPTRKIAALKCQLFHRAQKQLPHQNKGIEGRKEWEQEGSVTQRLWWMWELTWILIPNLPSCNPCIFISSPFCTSAPQSSVCEASPRSFSWTSWSPLCISFKLLYILLRSLFLLWISPKHSTSLPTIQ